MAKKEEILKILSAKLRKILESASMDYELLQELRLRVMEPFIIIYDGEEFFVSEKGKLEKQAGEGYMVTAKDVKETLEYISSFSLYAYEDEIRQGFITVQGGHRIGLAGKVILEQGSVKSVKHISSINIRMSHERKGCGKEILPYIYDGRQICHTLIISPPGCGKTTLLRDMVRLISNGDKKHPGMSVGVVDERSEIGACYRGLPQNDVGIRTDVLDCCPKAEGMLMMIRSMSPAVIAVDEIGKREDVEALAYVMNCGCQMLATVHGASIEDIKNKPVLRKLVEEKLFKRFVILSGERKPGALETIFDERGSVLFDRRCAVE
ncbi:MAG: stage III sporulation protein AA [Bacteroidales bacterium]|nr:stage III sporulation protein AA [Clostridium sp.]MCM1202629.1 stage III sporulation protein AA [Bacteroidales bacterium]